MPSTITTRLVLVGLMRHPQTSVCDVSLHVAKGVRHRVNPAGVEPDRRVDAMRTPRRLQLEDSPSLPSSASASGTSSVAASGTGSPAEASLSGLGSDGLSPWTLSPAAMQLYPISSFTWRPQQDVGTASDSSTTAGKHCIAYNIHGMTVPPSRCRPRVSGLSNQWVELD